MESYNPPTILYAFNKKYLYEYRIHIQLISPQSSAKNLVVV